MDARVAGERFEKEKSVSVIRLNFGSGRVLQMGMGMEIFNFMQTKGIKCLF